MAGETPRTSTSDAQQQLAEAIAAKKAQLRRLEGKKRQRDKRVRMGRYIAVGKVVEALGLLDVDPGELETLVKLGMEAHTPGDAPTRFAPRAQGEREGEKQGMRDNTFRPERCSEEKKEAHGGHVAWRS
jgi:hypothetical protein